MALRRDYTAQESSDTSTLSYSEVTQFDSIPNSYRGLRKFMSEHKNEIVINHELLDIIMDRLNRLLSSAENMTDLHKDTKLMLESIKISREAFLRTTRNGLSIASLVEMANNDELGQFYNNIKQKSLSISFIDCLYFENSENGRRKPVQRIKYDIQTSSAIEPETVSLIEEDNESSKAVLKIKRIVTEHHKIKFLDLIIDPQSYSKTISNAFNLSLASRNKAISFYVEENEVYVIPYTFSAADYDHAVLELTPHQHRQLVEILKIRKSVL